MLQDLPERPVMGYEGAIGAVPHVVGRQPGQNAEGEQAGSLRGPHTRGGILEGKASSA